MILYVLTRKQRTYSQVAISKLLTDRFIFDAKEDVLDYRDTAAQAANVPPRTLSIAVDALRSYTRGAPLGLFAEEFDPSMESTEVTYLPPRVYGVTVGYSF